MVRAPFLNELSVSQGDGIVARSRAMARPVDRVVLHLAQLMRARKRTRIRAP